MQIDQKALDLASYLFSIEIKSKIKKINEVRLRLISL